MTSDAVTAGGEVSPATASWRILRGGALGLIALLLLLSNLVFGPDPIFIGVALLVLLSAAFVYRGGRVLRIIGTTLGTFFSLVVVLLGGFSVLILVTHAPAILDITSLLILLIWVAGFVFLLASLLHLLQRWTSFARRPGAPRAVAGVGLLLLLAFLALGGVARVSAGSGALSAGDTELKIKDTKYSKGSLDSTTSLKLHITNQDGTFHTFTIDGVTDVTIPSSGQAEVSLNLKPGTYRYYCAVPGHADTMHGTLTVH